jgi:hypothetical protein
MKTLLTLALSTIVLAADASANAGPGPWSSGSYYPGGTDGKYQAAVYGTNISGIIGFTIREGSPAVTAVSSSAGGAAGGGGGGGGGGGAAGGGVSGGPGALAASNAVQAFDPTQNYFLIFVDGRTYSGLAAGSVNPVGKTVTGALLGEQPSFLAVTNTNATTSAQQLTWPSTVTTNFATNVTNQTILVTNNGVAFSTNISVSIIQTNLVTTGPFFSNLVTSNSFAVITPDPLPLLNRGLSGAFQAKIKNNQAYMTFKGNGQLSTPSQQQSLDLETNANGVVVGGTIDTAVVSFQIDGLRTSFLTASPAATSSTAAP